MMKKRKLGIIGGSGLYKMDGFDKVKWKKIKTSWGNPSDDILIAKLGKEEICFIPRHSRGHKINPTNINFRANIDAMKQMGITQIIYVSAVGSLKENLSPGTFVIVDQFIDRTFAREKSFFTSGLVAHVSMASPVCNRLGNHIQSAAKSIGIEIVRGGVYIAMEGPQFSSIAESELYRSWGCDVVGMTNMPEAKLAREAEMCYVSVAMVTDYDCWHTEHDNVSVDAMIKVLSANADNARSLVKASSKAISSDQLSSNCSCKSSLENAIITSPDARDKDLVKKLDAVAGRLLN